MSEKQTIPVVHELHEETFTKHISAMQFARRVASSGVVVPGTGVKVHIYKIMVANHALPRQTVRWVEAASQVQSI